MRFQDMRLKVTGLGNFPFPPAKPIWERASYQSNEFLNTILPGPVSARLRFPNIDAERARMLRNLFIDLRPLSQTQASSVTNLRSESHGLECDGTSV